MNTQERQSSDDPGQTMELFPRSSFLEGEPSFEYQLLSGHKRTDGSYKTGERLRMEYIQLTDGLVHQMTEGVEVEDPVTGETSVQKPDYVIWLDKSARPLSWLTRELWDTLAKDPETGEIPDMPLSRFVNIDREQWVSELDREGVGIMDIDGVHVSKIRSLRSIFVPNSHKKKGLTREIDTAPSELDGKVVLIVDEVRATGRTLDIAEDFFRRAFPTAKVASTHWMSGVASKGQAFGNRDLPIWYSEDEVYGRGVGNRDQVRSSKSGNRTQQLGAWFLSTTLPRRDVKAVQLRSEFKHLAEHPDVPVIPSFSRPRDELKERFEMLNPGKTYEEVLRAMQAVKGDPRVKDQ